MVLSAPRACLVLTALAVTCVTHRAVADPPPDPFKLYGNEMVFSVWRSGSEIGQHRVTFALEDGALVVNSLFDIAVKFLGITVYRFKYQSEEVWRDGTLHRLEATKDDNGTVAKVDARQEDGELAITGPKTHETAKLPLLPSTDWNAQVITADRVLNTLDGTVDGIKLVPVGVESVPVGGGRRQAMHYHYTGKIKADGWYDAQGHWVKLRFPGTDGTQIDYVCRICIAPP